MLVKQFADCKYVIHVLSVKDLLLFHSDKTKAEKLKKHLGSKYKIPAEGTFK